MVFLYPGGLGKSLASVWLALLITCLLGSQFVATTHQLAVRHATCPQHGDLIDVETAPADAAMAKQVSASNVTDTQRHHQHCLFVSSRGNHKGFKAAGPAVASTIPVAHPERSGYSAAPRRSLVLYLTAPKHSPPSA